MTSITIKFNVRIEQRKKIKEKHLVSRSLSLSVMNLLALLHQASASVNATRRFDFTDPYSNAFLPPADEA